MTEFDGESLGPGPLTDGLENPLYAKVRTLLAARRGQWTVIARESGVTYHTLVRIANGYVVSPGYPKLAALARYLDANPPASDAA
jgi:transcriptional regulator with XRE-family HTH domain